jgi:TRAP-type C4-dicarboxylate transport system substrate-binding protein
MIAGLVVVAVAMVLPASQVQADAQFKWKLQTIESPTGPGMSTLMAPWIEMVKEMSGGRLEITAHAMGELVPAREIVNGLDRNIIQIAWTSPMYYSGDIPESFLCGAAMPPMLFDRSTYAKTMYWDQLDPIMREAYAEKGVYFLNTVVAGGAIYQYSTKPIRNLEDMKGHKFRAFANIEKLFAKLGASPVFLPHPEVYPSIAQGVIDGGVGGSALFQFNKYYELAKYFHGDPLLSIDTLAFLVSMEAWKELPADLQEILKVAGRRYSEDYERLTDEWERQMFTHFDEWGVEMIHWPKEDIAKVRAAGVAMIPELKAKSPRLAKGFDIIEEFVKTHYGG